VRELIAARGDDHDLDVDMHGELTQHRGHQVALQPGERGARVARRSGRPGAMRSVRAPRRSEVEEDAQRLDEALPRVSLRSPSRAWWLVEQLGQHRFGQGVDLAPVLVGERGELAAPAFELARALGLEARPQGGHHRAAPRARLAER